MDNRIDQATNVFQFHRDKLGFVNRAQVSEKDLLIECDSGVAVAALLGNHCVRKEQSTIYELAVFPEYRRKGLAKRLVDRFYYESPHDRLIAKCPKGYEANIFYESVGFSKVSEESGKQKDLIVWEK